MELFERLNREQWEAVTAPIDGYNLVIASAGTGKTSTIVARIGYLIQQGVPPSQILLLTFTNKAAEEMKGRLLAHFPEARQVEAGTFHSVSYRWLRGKHPNLVVKTPKEMKLLLKSIYEKRQLHRLSSEARPFTPSYLYDLYSLAQNSGKIEIGEFGEWLLERYPEQEPFLWGYEDILEEFEELKRAHNLIDFNTLLIETIRELEKGMENPYRYVLVDEYQDTNPLQGRFLDRVERGNLFCVGDYDQSIYGFNGADISIISTFKERYPYARVYTLKKNYRSYGEILEIANRVIRFNPRIYPKELEVTRGYSGHYPQLLTFFDTTRQYREIARLIANSKTPHSEIAVLFRNNSSGDGIEAYLRQFKIGVKRRGGVGFFETREVKWALNFLTFWANPKDIMAFIGLMEYVKGVGGGVATDLFGHLSQLGGGNPIKGLLSPISSQLPPSAPRIATQLGLFEDGSRHRPPSLSKFQKVGVDPKFLTHPILKTPKLSAEGGLFLSQLASFLSTLPPKIGPAQLLERLFKTPFARQTKIEIATLRSKDRNGRIDREKFEQQMQRVEERWGILAQLAAGYREVPSFLTSVALGANEIAEGEGVNLLTIHASKGLEFKEVYLIDLMEGRFPNTRLANSGAGLEEERRLFYVAVTRAKDRLTLSMAYQDWKGKVYKPSRFLEEAGYKVKKI